MPKGTTTQQLQRAVTSEQLLRKTLLAINDGIAILDADKRIVYMNSAALRLFQNNLGVTPKPGDNYIDYVHEGRKELTRGYLEKALQNESTVFKLQYPQNGKESWFELGYYPLKDDEGPVQHIIVHAHEITQKVRLERKLKQQQKQVSGKVLHAILEAQEQERQTIGRELHDNINQILTTVKLYNEICLGEEEVNKVLLQKSVQQLNLVIAEIRNLSHRLASPGLEGTKLTELLEGLADSIRLTRRQEVHFFTYGVSKKSIGPEIQTILYRAAQEQLTNVLRHAEATHIEIMLVGISEMITLRISDNGKGFDTRKLRTGVGLLSMKSRVEAVGGKIEIESAPGAGCSVTLEVPI